MYFTNSGALKRTSERSRGIGPGPERSSTRPGSGARQSVALQYPLWLGKGGWFRVWSLERQVQEQKDANSRLRQRNSALDAEVRDLKQGVEAIEERARYELGMVRQDEIFFQVVAPAKNDRSR